MLAAVLVPAVLACGSGAPPRLPPPSATPWAAGGTTAAATEGPARARLDDRGLGRSGLACTDCHGTAETLDVLRPAPRLSGLPARLPLWSGLAPSVEVAVNLCVERWLARPALTGAALADLAAAAGAGAGVGAPPAAPVSAPAPVDESAERPEGDAHRGRAIYDAACRHCHEEGPGGALWGRAWARAALARTVRGLDRPRHPGTLMPPFGPEVLSDDALDDLTTALADAVTPAL